MAAAGAAQASGFLAAYLAGMALGNAGLPHRTASRSFAEGLGWLAQIGLFVLLCLLITPSQLAELYSEASRVVGGGEPVSEGGPEFERRR